MSVPARRPLLLGVLLVALAVLVSTTASTASAKRPGSTGSKAALALADHSLRGPVTDENFYFVMADRFQNGSTANDQGGLGSDPQKSGFDPTSKGYYNGGDLQGLRQKLDYIEGLGTDSIWLTPSFKNKAVQPEDSSAGYHGYWITDFTQIDPHLGSNADLAALIQDAHARGMKVYFDIITNHTADVIGYEEGARTSYVSKDEEPYTTASGEEFDDREYAGGDSFPAMDPLTSFPYTPVLDPAEKDLKVPAWLNDPTLYHNRGNTTFTGEDSQYGDFFGLDDLFTENPKVVDGFLDVYETWVKDFSVDGFRIDTMKHVDDAFWQKFGPGLVDYAKANGKPEFFMFGEVYDQTKSFTSRYTTHNKMQAILDFPFQEAARNFASKSTGNAALASFFAGDDWYTDADSNVYELPTFLGNHDMGRIGYFVKDDNKTASEQELLARDRLAHELMYFSRGNPVVYYGDEQGFTGTGGDQVARQTMFASQVEDYLDDDLLGTERTHAQDNFVTSHPIYQNIRTLSALTKRYPGLRDGAHQMRYASSGAGLVGFSRVDREQRREYVVVLNNSESTKSARIPTYVAKRGATKLYGPGASNLRTGKGRRLAVKVPGLSAVVYRINGTIPKSKAAPRISLGTPRPSSQARSRMSVSAAVAGRSFYEVTFQAKVGNGSWRSIGTDDTAPYRVFHDTEGLEPGTPLQYRAVVLDNNRHARLSSTRSTVAPTSTIKVSTPADGSEVSKIDPVRVLATVDPERTSQSVRFERSVSGGAWEDLGTDTSSPEYVVEDDVSDLPLGTSVRYRAVLLEPSQRTITSAPVTVTTADPKPAYSSVTLAGQLQSELGCPEDWQPGCAATHLAFDTSDGQWHERFTLPQGRYEWKIATGDSWDNPNFGANGGGDNLVLTVPAEGGTYRFTFNQVTHVPSVEKVG